MRLPDLKKNDIIQRRQDIDIPDKYLTFKFYRFLSWTDVIRLQEETKSKTVGLFIGLSETNYGFNGKNVLKDYEGRAISIDKYDLYDYFKNVSSEYILMNSIEDKTKDPVRRRGNLIKPIDI